MISVLFLIHDLGNGGAERVLINLVNNLDQTRFDITVLSLFPGENEKLLAPHIHRRTVFGKLFPGNSKIMKLFTPEQLHNWIVRNHYDIEIAYLEGPDSRIISGCRDEATHKLNWVHVEQGSRREASGSFRSSREAEDCYNRFEKTICVSETVKDDFTAIFKLTHPCEVLYNTVDSNHILEKSLEPVSEIDETDAVRLISVGTLKAVKGFDRLLHNVKRLYNEGENIRLYLLGDGPLRKELEEYVRENGLVHIVTFLGYQSNPYKFVAKCDLFICSSHREGFSTAVTEALIVGTPVVSTCCSGAYELLGWNDEYGIVVENSEEGIYEGMKKMVVDRELRKKYALKARERGRRFSTTETVRAVEVMLLSL